MAKTKPSHSDVFDINKKTGALILGKNRLDDYATKFLSAHYPAALTTPMALPVDELLEQSGLHVEYASLSGSSDVFGCCVLVDGDVQVYDKNTDSYYPQRYNAGTILIDQDSQASLGEGARRNVLIHEILHWEKDRVFFIINQARLARTGEHLAPIMSRASSTFFTPSEKSRTTETELQWLQWQAHRLAPRVLMPHIPFKNKALDLLSSDTISTCNELIDALAEVFLTPRSAVKYRLFEVGLKQRISQLPDFDIAYSLIHTEKYDFLPLQPIEAFELVAKNPRLQRWIKAGDFIFVDGYFVRNSERFVRINAAGKYVLKVTAKKNLDKCALHIQQLITKDYVGLDRDLDSLCYLEHRIGLDKCILYFDPSRQSAPFDGNDQKVFASVSKKMAQTLDEEARIIDVITSTRNNLCQTVYELLKSKGIYYPRTFTEKTGLCDALYNKIANNKQQSMKRETLMAIAIGSGLTAYATEELMKKAGIHLSRFQEPDRTYLMLLERYPGIDIYNANGILEAGRQEPLGSKIR